MLRRAEGVTPLHARVPAEPPELLPARRNTTKQKSKTGNEKTSKVNKSKPGSEWLCSPRTVPACPDSRRTEERCRPSFLSQSRTAGTVAPRGPCIGWHLYKPLSPPSGPLPSHQGAS
eukprot:757133-Hanusia_phi.AAC.1